MIWDLVCVTVVAATIFALGWAACRFWYAHEGRGELETAEPRAPMPTELGWCEPAPDPIEWPS